MRPIAKPVLYIVLYIALITGSLLGCQKNSSDSIAQLNSLPPLPQDPSIQVYFNHNEAADYTESDRNLKRSGDNLEQILLDSINQAKTDIKIAVQEFRLPRLAKALADRAKSGVKVEIVLENLYSTPYSSWTAAQLENLEPRERRRYQDNKALIDANQDGILTSDEIQTRDALVILDQGKIARQDDTSNGSKGSGLMHHKFMVIDGKTTIVTSANWTTSDIHGDFTNPSSRGNANSLIKINSPEVAQAFRQEFDILFTQRKFKTQKPDRPVQPFTLGHSKLQLHFSPSKPRWSSTGHKPSPWNGSSNDLIAEVATQAKTSLDLALFVFSDADLSNQLSVLPERKVRVRGLFDPGFFKRSYSRSLDMLGLPTDSPCRSPKPVKKSSRKSKKITTSKPWPTPAASVGIPKLKPGDLLHHKFAIVDRTTVIFGSHNWTPAANHKNDETLMVIENPTIAAHYQREFDRLSKDAILGLHQCNGV
jgi:phosphatidylserine/phosphatidylglycerophosphate/cardiolipin synthase-like enzyme